MIESEVAKGVAEILEIDINEYQHRVREDGDRIKRAINDGDFDNPQAIIGFEYEFYAADQQTDTLKRVPRRLLEYIGFEKELGLHNAEMSTTPQPLNRYGLLAQEYEIKSRLAAALQITDAEGITLVSDGMWTISPVGEPADRYLCDHIEDGRVRLATNMSSSSRYHAMANVEGSTRPAMHIEAPNVTLRAETVMLESLITSIQPHYQVPQAGDLSTHFNYAIRFAGPLVALGANSPIYPPELYDDVDPETIFSDSWSVNRISIFESVLNPSSETDDIATKKVRFPKDLSSVEEAVDRIVDDPVLIPVAPEPTDRYDDQFGYFRVKHGTYWRWIRPVFDGATRSNANARIEFRPIDAQPTVRDSVAIQALVAGLLESLPRRDHPLIAMTWERARSNFYSGAMDGLDAKFEWIDNSGAVIHDTKEIFEDIFAHARDGLELRGLTENAADRYIEPLEWRVANDLTPAAWKLNHAMSSYANGTAFESSIFEMQHEYCERQRQTFLEGCFVDWFE